MYVDAFKELYVLRPRNDRYLYIKNRLAIDVIRISQ